MLYHVRISTKSEVRDEAKIGLSREQVLGEILVPLRAGEAVVVNGRTIEPSDVTRVSVSRSARSIADLEQEVRHERANSPIIVAPGPSDAWLVADKGQDCSDELHAEAKKMANTNAQPTPQATGFKPDPRSVFVVHGRDLAIKDGMFHFLRSLDLRPIEWETARKQTGKATPYVGEILSAGFGMAQAAVVLLTGDDEARLRKDLHGPNEPATETQLTPQPRPNVILEAGMALGKFEERTVLVQFGSLRPVSDLLGRHILRMDGSGAKRRELAGRLKTAGCAVDDQGSEWLTAGNFQSPGPVRATEEAHPSAPFTPLSRHANDILYLMLYSGRPCLHAKAGVGMFPEHIVVGRVSLYDNSNPEVALDYVLARRDLSKRELLRWDQDGDVAAAYTLTDEGVDAAKALRAEGWKVASEFPEARVGSPYELLY